MGEAGKTEKKNFKLTTLCRFCKLTKVRMSGLQFQKEENFGLLQPIMLRRIIPIITTVANIKHLRL